MLHAALHVHPASKLGCVVWRAGEMVPATQCNCPGCGWSTGRAWLPQQASLCPTLTTSRPARQHTRALVSVGACCGSLLCPGVSRKICLCGFMCNLYITGVPAELVTTLESLAILWGEG